MQLSKISKNTYHKCVKELHEAKYIYYHPSPSKFQAVRISIVRLDKEEEPTTRYHQLDLFTSLKSETGRVAISRPASTNNETATVSNLGHIIKPNNKTERNLPTPNFLEKGNEIQKKKNASPPVPNSILTEKGIPSREGLGVGIPMLSEVEAWFANHSYPHSEATKFYNHYKSLGWKIQGKTPIADWKPLVEKWMANAKRWEGPTEPKSVGPHRKDITIELQYLYDSFLDGKKIFQHITTEHFEILNLSLDEETMQQAWRQRINDVAGTNQHSLNQIWQAYLTNNPEHELVKKDYPNFIVLARRIAVIKHFQQCKQRNIKILSTGASLRP